MSFKNSLRDRAIAAYKKRYPDATIVRVWKIRSQKIITVRGNSQVEVAGKLFDTKVFYSYKNGGKLEKVA